MLDEELPTACPSCTDAPAALDRFLFQSGTVDAHVRWVCVAADIASSRQVITMPKTGEDLSRR